MRETDFLMDYEILCDFARCMLKNVYVCGDGDDLDYGVGGRVCSSLA